MIDPWRRELLRRQALHAWENSKQLHQDATALVLQARDVRRMVRRRRKVRTEPFSDLVHHLDEPVSGRQALAAHELEFWADHAIRGFGASPAEHGTAGGAGLVASVNLPTLARVQKLVEGHLGHVMGARDAGTTLGLAITAQPDIAIIDTNLGLARGADVVVTLPRYAPNTKALLLSDDEETAARVGAVGIDTLPHDSSDDRLSSWVAAAAGL